MALTALLNSVTCTFSLADGSVHVSGVVVLVDDTIGIVGTRQIEHVSPELREGIRQAAVSLLSPTEELLGVPLTLPTGSAPAPDPS